MHKAQNIVIITAAKLDGNKDQFFNYAGNPDKGSYETDSDCACADDNPSTEKLSSSNENTRYLTYPSDRILILFDNARFIYQGNAGLFSQCFSRKALVNYCYSFPSPPLCTIKRCRLHTIFPNPSVICSTFLCTKLLSKPCT